MKNSFRIIFFSNILNHDKFLLPVSNIQIFVLFSILDYFCLAFLNSYSLLCILSSLVKDFNDKIRYFIRVKC